MRIIRTTAALAVALAAATAGAARADVVGTVIGAAGSLTVVDGGGSTGVVDMFGVNRRGEGDHYAHFLCEYAVNADGTGHFEAAAVALVGGTISPAQDVKSLDVLCTYYGTPNGSPYPLEAKGSSNPAARSENGAVGRPSKICMTGTVTWDDDDTVSVSEVCQFPRVRVRLDDVAVHVGTDSGTDRIVDGGTTTVAGCADRRASCDTATLKEYAATVADTVRGGYRPGVEVGVDVPPPVR